MDERVQKSIKLTSNTSIIIFYLIHMFQLTIR